MKLITFTNLHNQQAFCATSLFIIFLLELSIIALSVQFFLVNLEIKSFCIIATTDMILLPMLLELVFVQQKTQRKKCLFTLLQNIATTRNFTLLSPKDFVVAERNPVAVNFFSPSRQNRSCSTVSVREHVSKNLFLVSKMKNKARV